MSEEYVRVDVGTVRLSLAVRLRDAFGGGRPRGSPRLSLVGRPEQFVETPSGYHVLTGLPGDASTVTVAVDPGDQYLPERREEDVVGSGSTGDDAVPAAVGVDLLAAPAYRFPADATLVRGFTRTKAGSEGDESGADAWERVPDVDLVVRDERPGEEDVVLARGRSDADGEFVLPFTGVREYLTDRGAENGNKDTGPPDGNEGKGKGQGEGNGGPGEDDEEDGQVEGTFVEVDGGDPVIEASTDGLEGSVAVAVEEGETAVANVELTEQP